MKICLVSTSRADLGQLSDLIKLLQSNNKINFKFIVTGLHLSRLSNYSYKEAANYNIKIDKKIAIDYKKFDNENINLYLSSIIRKFSFFLAKFKPNLIILLGDRYDTFACAIAAYFNNIAIAHLHGGEITVGSKDDSVRHSITKLASYHFPANKIFQKRLVKMGEDPKNIFTYGALGIDKLNKIKFKNKMELSQQLGIKFLKKNILITLHPESDKKNTIKLTNLLLEVLKKYKDINKFICSPNADANSDYIRSKILNFIKKQKNSYYFQNLGFVDYLSLAKSSNFVIGNSSSCVTELPALNIPTLNIGNRQLGRPFAKSVVFAKTDYIALTKKIKNMLYLKINKKKQLLHYYGNNCTNKIYKKIISLSKKKYLNKYFYEYV
jgi:UDP-hydrolysing UDP-N-acetyl-D-glucosamine 2-epimerase